MHEEILSAAQKKLKPTLVQFRKNFFLGGGTAIALNLGHRRSIDFDLFTQDELGLRSIENKLNQAGVKIEKTLNRSIDELTVLVAGVKLSFILYPFPVTGRVSWGKTIQLPSLLHLAAMKAYALGRRAKWKDCVDLFFIIRDHFSVSAISHEAERIFGGAFNSRSFREQLAYFEDMDYSEAVKFMPGRKTSDAEIKKFLEKAGVS